MNFFAASTYVCVTICKHEGTALTLAARAIRTAIKVTRDGFPC